MLSDVRQVNDNNCNTAPIGFERTRRYRKMKIGPIDRECDSLQFLSKVFFLSKSQFGLEIKYKCGVPKILKNG